MYNPNIARWNGVDALAEKYSSWSPYNYVSNSPLKFIDPDGNEPILPLVGTIEEAVAFFRTLGLSNANAVENFYANPVDSEGNRLGQAIIYVMCIQNKMVG